MSEETDERSEAAVPGSGGVSGAVGPAEVPDEVEAPETAPAWDRPPATQPWGTEDVALGPGLVLAATPIGNTADASAHLLSLLAGADLVAAEDTRRLWALAQRLGVRPRGSVVSCHEHNEASRVEQVVDAVRAGRTVALVTDAGMPTVSDPGYRLVRAVLDAGLPVHVAPGPSAVTAALAVAGLPTDRFCFEGFLPRRPGERTRALTDLARERRTMVFFESPRRTGATLAEMAAAWGSDRPAAVCRELTKTYEEVRRGTLADLADWASPGLLGEVTIVVGGARATAADLPALVAEAAARADAGERLKDVCAQIAARDGVGRRELYEAVLDLRRNGDRG